MILLRKAFEKLNIDYSKIGFYDSLEFIENERLDPKFLEKYAEYVSKKDLTRDYISKAYVEIPFIAKLLNEELIKDGRLGACIDISIILTRILEKEGYWNYQTKGSLTIKFPKKSNIKTLHFWSVDFGEFNAGHSWIVAPPFTIIDLAVKQQVFKNGQEKHIPNFICSASKKTTSISDIDIISPEASAYFDLNGITKNKLLHVRNDFYEFIKKFPPIEAVDNQLILKYITTGISAPDQPLEKVATLNLNGKFGYEIYNDVIKPKLVEFRRAL